MTRVSNTFVTTVSDLIYLNDTLFAGNQNVQMCWLLKYKKLKWDSRYLKSCPKYIWNLLNTMKIVIWGHSKSMSAQYSQVLTPCLPPFSPLLVFKHPPLRKVRPFWLELTRSYLISMLVKFRVTKLIMTRISTEWTPLLHDKSVLFIDSPSKNQKSLKLNMKSTICHDFPRPDLLEGPKDRKIKESGKVFSF